MDTAFNMSQELQASGTLGDSRQKSMACVAAKNGALKAAGHPSGASS